MRGLISISKVLPDCVPLSSSSIFRYYAVTLICQQSVPALEHMRQHSFVNELPFYVPSWNTARELELYLTIVPRLDIVCNRHMLGWQAFRAQRGCVYVEGLYRIVLSVCIRRRRGLVQLQRGDWTHHAWPTQLQLSV